MKCPETEGGIRLSDVFRAVQHDISVQTCPNDPADNTVYLVEKFEIWEGSVLRLSWLQ